MKLFVTGICGRLGRALATEAIRQGHSVTGMDLVPWPVKFPRPPGLEIIAGSFEDLPLAATHMKSADAFVHTAGLHGDYVKTHSLAQFLHSNVELAASLLETAAQAGVRHIVLSSTMEILMGRDWTASGATILDEECPPRCDSAYSLSRLLQEQLAKEFCRQHPVSIASLRYMAFGYGRDENLGPSLLARSVAARDAARAVLLAAGKDHLAGDVFHIGPQTPLVNADLIAAIASPAAVVEKYFPGAVPVLEANGCKLSLEHFWPVTRIRKAQLILGWNPEYTFERWLLDHGWKKP